MKFYVMIKKVDESAFQVEAENSYEAGEKAKQEWKSFAGVPEVGMVREIKTEEEEEVEE